MPDADNDIALFTLRRKEDGVWIEHQECVVKLGEYDAVCDELCRFLESEELGECASAGRS